MRHFQDVDVYLVFHFLRLGLTFPTRQNKRKLEGDFLSLLADMCGMVRSLGYINIQTGVNTAVKAAQTVTGTVCIVIFIFCTLLGSHQSKKYLFYLDGLPYGECDRPVSVCPGLQQVDTVPAHVSVE